MTPQFFSSYSVLWWRCADVGLLMSSQNSAEYNLVSWCQGDYEEFSKEVFGRLESADNR